MNWRFILIIGIVLQGCTSSNSNTSSQIVPTSNWVMISVSKDQKKALYIDPKTIQIRGDIRQYDILLFEGREPDPWWTWVRKQIDCERREMLILSAAEYTNKGIASPQADSKPQFEVINPNTRGEIELEYLCNTPSANEVEEK